MQGSALEPTLDGSDERSLPDWLETDTRLGRYGLVVGTGLCLLALFTNAVPDPSLPWFSLPEAYRLPITQPRIEHWPVSYTVGIWLWIGCLPAVFLRGYELVAGRVRLGPAAWLVGLPTVAMLALTTYCRVFWPKPDPATWNAPAYTFVCWAYCSTYEPLWSDLAYLVAGFGVTAFALVVRRSSLAVATEVTFRRPGATAGAPGTVRRVPASGLGTVGLSEA